MRREEKQGVPGWLWTTAYVVAGGLFLARSRPSRWATRPPAGRSPGRAALVLTTHDGLDLHVHVEGPRDAALTVVLAHCWTSDYDSWRYQVTDLRHRFGDAIRVVSYDHRGHGASDETPRHTATIENLGRDLSDLIDAHAPTGQLVLAGHSIGGMTLMALAERRPELFAERVRGVLFVSTSGGSLQEVTLGLPRITDRMRAHIPTMLAMRSKMVGRKRRRRAPWIETVVARRCLFGDDMRLRDHALAVEGLINTPATSMCGFFEDVMRHDRIAGLSALEGIPVHVMVGDRDLLTPPSHAELLAEKISGATLTVAPGAGHMLPLERDVLVSQALVELVQQALANPGHAVDGKAGEQPGVRLWTSVGVPPRRRRCRRRWGAASSPANGEHRRARLSVPSHARPRGASSVGRDRQRARPIPAWRRRSRRSR